jgi:hypothetical protein
MNAPRPRPLADLLLLLVGPVVWFLHLVVLYGTEALICTPPVGTEQTMMRLGAVATGTAVAVLVILIATPAPGADQRPGEHTGAAFLHSTTLLLALLSGIGVIWNALPLALAPVCAAAG